MSPLLRFTLTMALLAVAWAAVVHINSKSFHTKINQSPYTLIYFYSSSCNYCKEFTPIFEKLARNPRLNQLNVTFAKIDGPAFQNLTHSLDIYLYPSVLLYRKGVSLPLHYWNERKQQPILDFLLSNTQLSAKNELLAHISGLTPQQRVEQKAGIFYGKPDSLQLLSWDVIARRDGYISWAFVEQQQTKLVIGDQEITNFSNLQQVQRKIAAIFARLHEVSEQSWLKMVQRKILTIVYFNKFGNNQAKELLSQIAKQSPEVNFIQIDGEHPEYAAALRAVGIHDEENIVAVDRKYNLLYVAPQPYSYEGIKDFIDQAKQHKLEVYRKTQKTDKLNKLTRDNYQQKMSTPQDVLLFLYDKSEPKSKELLKHFEYLVNKLQNNKNLLLLRCDVSVNEVEEKLGFTIKPTPKIVFFRNRMKDYPIHFTGSIISTQSLVEFIMENTTFDFEEEWVEL